jgi:hypothetical protein
MCQLWRSRTGQRRSRLPGAGIVLRCPHCDNVLAKIVKSDSRVWIDSTGIRTLEVRSEVASVLIEMVRRRSRSPLEALRHHVHRIERGGTRVLAQ